MRYTEIINETREEVNAIISISDKIASALKGLIEMNIRQATGKMNDTDPADLDWMPPVAANPVTIANWFDQPTQRTTNHRRMSNNLSPEDLEAYFGNENQSALWSGRHGAAKGNRYHLTSTEVGTIDELLKYANVTVAPEEEFAYNALKDVWLILTNDSSTFGMFRSKATDKYRDKVLSNDDSVATLDAELLLCGPYFIRNFRIAEKKLRSLLVHEITHAVDHAKTNGRDAYRKDGTHKSRTAKDDDVPFQDYLKLPYEINARYVEMINALTAAIKKDPSVAERDKFLPLMKRLIVKHKLDPSSITAAKSQQTIKRALKHFDVKS